MRLLSLIQTLLLLLFFALGFSLSTCAPFPKEGEYKEEFQLNLQLQTRNSNRLGRTNSISERKSEFAELYSETFSQMSKVTLGTPSTVAFDNVPPDTYQIRLFRLDQDLPDGTTDFGSSVIDLGISQDPFTVSSSSSTFAVIIQLIREAVFLDSPVEGLSYTAGGNSGITNQDGLIYYFPNEPIHLTLGNLDLGTFTNPGDTLTPYDVMGVVEGTAADKNTNFARLLQSFDNDSNPKNGIQLSSSLSLPISTIDGFNDNNSFTSQSVSAEKATSHLARSMHYKNQTNFEVLFKLPDNGTDNVSTNSLIAIAFNKPLRKGNLAATLTLNGTDLPVHAVERNWLLFQPTLTAGTSYQAILKSAFSFKGDTLTSTVPWSFKAGSASTEPFPNVIQLSPDNGTNNHLTDTVPTITFNGPVFQCLELFN